MTCTGHWWEAALAFRLWPQEETSGPCPSTEPVRFTVSAGGPTSPSFYSTY